VFCVPIPDADAGTGVAYYKVVKDFTCVILSFIPQSILTYSSSE
jgi:hypothetical protein